MGKIKEERPQPGNKERGTMELERRGHLAASRVLSNGPDIRPDVNVSPNEYVKVEDFHKWMKANDAVLRARTRQSFVAGAICGVFVLVAIIMAAVSLDQIDKNGGRLTAHEKEKVKFEDLGFKINMSMVEGLEIKLKEKVKLEDLGFKISMSMVEGLVNKLNDLATKGHSH